MCDKISNKKSLRIKEFMYFEGTSHCRGKDMAGAGAVDIVKRGEDWYSSRLLLSVHNPDPGKLLLTFMVSLLSPTHPI